MIFSANLRFSDDQDISTTVGTVNSTNVVDTGAAGTVYGAGSALSRNVGPGKGVPILVQITETVLSGGAATIEFQIETSDVEGFGSTNVVIARSSAYAKTDLVAGFQFGVAVLPNDCKRFLRVNYVIAGATTTAGLASAGIVHGVQTNG